MSRYLREVLAEDSASSAGDSSDIDAGIYEALAKGQRVHYNRQYRRKATSARKKQRIEAKAPPVDPEPLLSPQRSSGNENGQPRSLRDLDCSPDPCQIIAPADLTQSQSFRKPFQMYTVPRREAPLFSYADVELSQCVAEQRVEESTSSCHVAVTQRQNEWGLDAVMYETPSGRNTQVEVESSSPSRKRGRKSKKAEQAPAQYCSPLMSREERRHHEECAADWTSQRDGKAMSGSERARLEREQTEMWDRIIRRCSGQVPKFTPDCDSPFDPVITTQRPTGAASGLSPEASMGSSATVGAAAGGIRSGLTSTGASPTSVMGSFDLGHNSFATAALATVNLTSAVDYVLSL